MSFKTKVNVLENAECLPVNCRISGGQVLPALSPALLKAGDIPSGIVLAEYREASKLFFICADSALYASNGGAVFMKISSVRSGYPFIIDCVEDGNPCTVISDGVDAIKYLNSKYSYYYSCTAGLRCGVMHCGRLFGIDVDDAFKLRWSGEGGWNDWKEGIHGSGYLTLDPARGEVLDILEFGEKLVAVRRFGLTVLKMFGLPENYSVEFTDTDSVEIYKGTARVVGGKLVFCTAGGLRSFDGSAIKQLNCGRDIQSPVCSAALGGKYFLSCKIKSLNGGVVLCLDAESGENYFINISADGLCADGKHVYAYNASGSYRFSEGGEFTVYCANIDFGSARFKTVTAVYADGGCSEAEISNGRAVRKFSDVNGLIRPNLRGKSFTFKIKGREPLRSVTASAEECNAI